MSARARARLDETSREESRRKALPRPGRDASRRRVDRVRTQHVHTSQFDLLEFSRPLFDHRTGPPTKPPVQSHQRGRPQVETFGAKRGRPRNATSPRVAWPPARPARPLAPESPALGTFRLDRRFIRAVAWGALRGEGTETRRPRRPGEGQRPRMKRAFSCRRATARCAKKAR